jgi:Gpi18-like mannosyltransferase
MLAVLYRLVLEDFDRAQAWNAVLYLAVFPTAFFFAAAYNESLFLLFTLLAFYYMRRSSWWLAGVFGLLASLTRSAGICLLLPFCYEYLRQQHFSLQKLRLDALACAGAPAGIGLFALYCYLRFHDLLAFSHAQSVWNRSMHGPWHGLIDAAVIILHRAVLSFDEIHNMIDLSACLFILALVILAFIGPWKFSGAYRVYGLYAALIYLFSLIFPISGGVPLGAFSRYMLEVFPAFIVLAAMGKKQQANLYYLMLSVPLLTFLLLQFLTDRWVI